MVLKPWLSCPGGERQCWGWYCLFSVCFSRFWTGGTVCGSGSRSSLPCPRGVRRREGRVGRGHCSRCFLSVRWGGWGEVGPRGAFSMTETSGWVTSLPLFVTPPSPDMCQSVPGQYGGPARLPLRHVLPRQGLAALRSTAHQHESFSPRPPAKCVGSAGINETSWINKHSWWALEAHQGLELRRSAMLYVAAQVGLASPVFALQSYTPNCQMATSPCQTETHTCERTHMEVNPFSSLTPTTPTFHPSLSRPGCRLPWLPTHIHPHAHHPTAAVYPICNTWLAIVQLWPKGTQRSQAERKGVSGVGGGGGCGGRMEGRLVDWSSVWLGLVGCNWCPLFQKPCSDGGQDDSLRIFPAIRNVCACACVCVCVHEWIEAHTFRGHTTGDRDTDNVHRDCVSGQPRGKCYDKRM